MSVDLEAMSAATAPLSDELPRPEPEEKKPEPKAEAKPEPNGSEPKPEPADPDPEPDPDEEKQPRKRGGIYQRNMERMEAELAALRAQIQQTTPPKTAEAPKAEAPQPDGSEPKLADFETYDDFVVAKAEWKLEQKAKVKADAENAVKAKSDHDKWIEAAKAKFEDFEEVALSNDIPIADPTVIAIKESDYGADIAYYLGQNPEEAKRIANLSPLGQAKAIGKIEARFEKEAEAEEKPAAPPPPKKATTAPKPPSRVSGRGNAEPTPEKMGNAEFRAWRASGGGKA